MTAAVKTSRCPLRYEIVAENLREDIRSGRLAIGDQVPPVDKLCGIYSVSRVTALRALQVLVKEGLVETRRGPRGTTVKRDRVRPSMRHRSFVAVTRPTHPFNLQDNFALEMIQSISNEMAGRGLWRLPVTLGEEDLVGRVAEGIAEGGARAALVDQKTPRPTVERIVGLGRPVVLFNRVLDLPGVTCVCPDYGRVSSGTVQRFRQRGFERLGFFYVPQAPGGVTEAWLAAMGYALELRSSFARRAVEAGYAREDVLMLPDDSVVDGVRGTPTYGLPSRRPDGWRRLGILSTSPRNAYRLRRDLNWRGYTPGRDFEVIAAIDMELSRWMESPPSAWRIELEPLARETVDALERVSRDPEAPPEVRRTPVTFVDRGA